MELISEPDVEDIYIGFLAEELPLHGPVVAVGSKVPNPRPSESVVVFQTGGRDVTKVSTEPLLTVEARAKTETRARELCSLAVALIKASDGMVLSGHQIYGIQSSGGIVNLPDPLNDQPRYTVTLAIHLRSSITA